MGSITYGIPAAGLPNSTEDTRVSTALQTLLTLLSGNVDGVNVSAAFAQAVGANQAVQTVKGAVNIAASESTASGSFATLSTPDQVTGIVLPVNGLIEVVYGATHTAGIGQAAIFLDSVQAQAASANSHWQGQAGTSDLDPTPYWSRCYSTGSGLNFTTDATTGPIPSDPPTGAIVGPSGSDGGPCYLFAAAGTYTVSVRFKATSGSFTLQSRKLWVQALSFA